MRVAPLSGKAVPTDGFGIVLWDALAIGVHVPEVVLRVNVTLLGGSPPVQVQDG